MLYTKDKSVPLCCLTSLLRIAEVLNIQKEVYSRPVIKVLELYPVFSCYPMLASAEVIVALHAHSNTGSTTQTLALGALPFVFAIAQRFNEMSSLGCISGLLTYPPLSRRDFSCDLLAELVATREWSGSSSWRSLRKCFTP